MTDQDAFERLVAEEAIAEAGPSRPTDVAAVVRSVATESPRWRFRSMFSATKMLTATAVLALAGGVLVVSELQPKSQELEAPGAATVPAEPVEFHARWLYGDGVAAPDRSWERRGGDWSGSSNVGWTPYIAEPGDPRLEGTVQLAASSMSHGTLQLWNGAFRIENEAGAWQQRPMIQSVQLSDQSEPMTWTAVFDGEGEYAGLALVAGITRGGGGWDVEGVIVDTTVLPATPTTLDFDE